MSSQRPSLPHLCHYGHIASYRELLTAAGGQAALLMPFRQSVPRFEVAGARGRDGGAAARDRSAGGYAHLHLRHNVYVCRHIDDDEFTAALVGGLLDCVTVLGRLGVPAELFDAGALCNAAGAEPVDAGGLHVRVPPRSGRTATRARAEPRVTRVHWSARDPGVPTLRQTRAAAGNGSPVSRLQVAPRDALTQALTTCLPLEQAAPVIRTMVPALLPAAEVARAIAAASRRVRVGLRRLDLPLDVHDALNALA
ncbi:MAG: hypothetical protein FWD85_03800 [Microbacteriaceae bacterium]|nr:hypothetical protein [Microbacteriaceae bacterium]MCL2794414.1 hypothetical protein [Microbacteriaceae bacterium]